MMVGEGPVGQKKIQIVKVQIVERFAAAAGRIPRHMHVVPQLGGDPNPVARLAGADNFIEVFANLRLVAVHRCAVK
jgi:hypothetical protein